MKSVVLLPLVLASIAAAGAAALPRFAEDLPPEAGYWVVLKLTPGDDGRIRFCTLHGVHESSAQGPVADVAPSEVYVADACRKLSTKKWKIERDAAGEVEPTFYFCRYLESVPGMAYCERRFGD